MNELFTSALSRKAQKTPPIWFMRQAGRYHSHYQGLRKKYSFEELCKIPELAAETTLGPIRDFDFDVAILFSDLLFPLEAMGMGLSYADGPPKLGFSLNRETLPRLRNDAEAKECLRFQGKAASAVRHLLPKDRSLLGFVGGPWTLFVYATEGGHQGSLLKSKCAIDTLFEPFCEILEPLLFFTIEEQLKGGAEKVMVFDTAAGELSPGLYEARVVPWLERLTSKFPGQLGYYGKGFTHDHLKPAQKPNWCGMGLDHRFRLDTLLPSWNKGFLQGNFDQALLHLPKIEFDIAAKSYLEPFQRLSQEQRKGWVSALGHGVLPATPERNVKKFIELIRESF